MLTNLYAHHNRIINKGAPGGYDDVGPIYKAAELQFDLRLRRYI